MGNTFVIKAHAAPTSAPALPAASASGNWPGFPQQDPALVREIVGASQGNIARVRELVTAHPSMANASYDWGFGAATMLGFVDVVQAALTANPALALTRGPHGISLIAHARMAVTMAVKAAGRQ